jgi:antitoxin YefM
MQLEWANDFKPISEFRANATDILKKIQTTRRPIILTHHGRSAGVLLAVEDYEALLAKIEVLADLAAAKLDIMSGDVHTDQSIREKLNNPSKRA